MGYWGGKMKKRLLHRSWDILSQAVHGASCSMINTVGRRGLAAPIFHKGARASCPLLRLRRSVGAAEPHRPTRG
jgi:hypothetical protein